MAPEKKLHLPWFSEIFEPRVDFFELLNKQADKTLEGVVALRDWIKAGGLESCPQVKELEREADSQKANIQQQLVNSFVTPFDREDIYELTSSLDEVINTAKAVVREMEAMEVSSSGTRILEMAEVLVDGTIYLQKSIYALRKNLPEAKEQALLSRKSDSRFNKIYRPAMKELLAQDDFKKIFRVREVYKVMLLGAERIEVVGERILHAVVKMS
ncbi:MAG: DUF47 family protein [Candidatus Obscuribacterales bacterium]|nr:DUF47 family protein [Candidatus Obscuribacterales bacterium]